ncbi:aromatic ring-hydroxylating dioxygenase subunit alpha [bacterium]|nr:aromatic ring-hydroxylating dioxygenase subunit alpha [bacterium]
MKNYWYIAATSAELKKQPLARVIDGVPLVLFRDADGRASALADRCSHRNVQLSRGWVEDGCLTCPYHGWAFDAAGQCVKIPALCDGDPIPKKSAVQAYPLIEQQGYVWVYVGDGDPEAQRPFHLPHMDEAGWSWTRLEATIGNSANNLVENFIDCPHTGFIHRGLFRTAPDHAVETVVKTREDGVDIEIDEEAKSQSLLGRLVLKPGEKVTHVDSFHMPSIVSVRYAFGAKREVIGYQICTPVSELETRVYVHVTWRLGPLAPLIKPFVAIAGRKVLAQDLWILENQGEQIRRYGADFCSSQADTANLWIQNLRNRVLRGEDPMADREKRVRFRL